MPYPQNPFIVSRPLRAGDPYVGRTELVASIDAFLTHTKGNQLAIVQGAKGFGKSSTLAKLEHRFHSSEPTLLSADVRQLSHESPAELLWSLTKSFSGSLLRQGISPPPIEKALLLLNPRRSFQLRYWLPLLQILGQRKLFIALDNIDEHLRPIGALEGLSLFEFIPELLAPTQQAKCLFTTRVRVTAFPVTILEPFGQPLVQRLPPLSGAQVRQLLRHMPAAFVPNAVSNYILALTKGHPADVQRLAHALYERCRAHNVRTATTADLIAVLAYDTEPLDFHGPIYRRRRQARMDVKTLDEGI